jgi:hypothetical protein
MKPDADAHVQATTSRRPATRFGGSELSSAAIGSTNARAA